MDRRADRLLGQAVVRQCVVDLFTATLSGSYGDDDHYERFLAMRFLTADHGEWKQSREDWCIMADIDPDLLSKHIIDVLEGREVRTDGTEKQYRLNAVDVARSLWREEKDRIATQRVHAQELRNRRLAVEKERRERAAWANATRLIEEANHRLRYGT